MKKYLPICLILAVLAVAAAFLFIPRVEDVDLAQTGTKYSLTDASLAEPCALTLQGRRTYAPLLPATVEGSITLQNVKGMERVDTVSVTFKDGVGTPMFSQAGAIFSTEVYSVIELQEPGAFILCLYSEYSQEGDTTQTRFDQNDFCFIVFGAVSREDAIQALT